MSNSIEASEKKYKVVVCSSASFYPEVIKLSYKLEELGFEVVLPSTAERMKHGEENVEAVTDWAKSPAGYHGKTLLIREHFDKIAKGDAILVANYEKHGKQNYIGPNVLMEMSIAFYLNKPIHILNGQPQDSPLIDEILALGPIMLHGDLSLLQ